LAAPLALPCTWRWTPTSRCRPCRAWPP